MHGHLIIFCKFISIGTSVMRASILAGLLMTTCSVASADLIQYSRGAGSFGGNGASFDGISTSYDTGTQILTWEVDNARKNGALMDGFWLVLNDGPSNPKGGDGLAIFYADFVNHGGSDNTGLWVFEYNGQNNPSSYQSHEYFGNFSSGLIDSGDIRGFELDVSSIYSQLATDAPYDDQIGIWFHPTWGTLTGVDNTGQLDSWWYRSQGWYDAAGRDTTRVSEPSVLMLFGLGFLGLRLTRKKGM